MIPEAEITGALMTPESNPKPTFAAAAVISRPPTRIERVSDRVFRQATYVVALLTIALVIYLVFSIAHVAMPAMHAYGVSFLTGTTWDANRSQFGILPAIVGTLYSSVLGLIIGTAFGLAIAIFLSEGFLALALDVIIGSSGLSDNAFWSNLPNSVEHLLQMIIELLAAIPSVVYGLWGIFVIIPLIRPPAEWLAPTPGMDSALRHHA